MEPSTHKSSTLEHVLKSLDVLLPPLRVTLEDLERAESTTDVPQFDQLCTKARIVCAFRRQSEATQTAQALRMALNPAGAVGGTEEAWGYVWLSRLMLLTGDLPQAIEAARMAVEAAKAAADLTTRTEAMRSLGRAYQANDDWRDALATMEEAMDLMDSDTYAVARAEHALLALACGDRSAAGISMRVALDSLDDRQVHVVHFVDRSGIPPAGRSGSRKGMGRKPAGAPCDDDDQVGVGQTNQGGELTCPLRN